VTKLACPKCGVPSLRIGAVKCPACKTWVGALPDRPPSLRERAAITASVATLGAILGGAAVFVGLGANVSARFFPPKPPPAEPKTPASASTAEAAAPKDAPKDAPARAPFGEPRIVRVAAAPLDVAIADDDATFFILGDDGAVRAYELATGKELRKVNVPGKGSELRLLAGKHLAVLGAVSALPIIDLATYIVGRADLGGAAVDVVALDDAPSFIAASAGTRKLARFSLEGFRLEGQATLPRAPTGLGLAREPGSDGSREGSRGLLVVLSSERGVMGVGSVDLIDPAVTPFGASRRTWMAATDPRWGFAAEATAFVVDASQSRVVAIPTAPGAAPPVRVRVDGRPISAHHLAGGWVVTVNGVGSVTVLEDRTLAPRGTLALGAEPAGAAVTPDGRALLVSLGGSPGERGAMTAVVMGDPPALAERIPTGPGSRAVRMSKSGRFVAVAAYAGRSVALLERR
jgi:hypothetical protein